MVKRILSLLLCVSLAASLCSCTVIINKIKYETPDTNGEEDYSLAVLTEEEICAEDNGCYAFIFNVIPSGEKSYTDEDYLHDADEVFVTAGSPLSGVALLHMTYGTADNITFTVECNRTKGNLRIVLLDENYEIVYDFSVSEASSYTVCNAKGKSFEIRAAGESTEFKINIVREFSDT